LVTAGLERWLPTLLCERKRLQNPAYRFTWLFLLWYPRGMNTLHKFLRFFHLAKPIVVATGGCFDPIHEGHIRLFKDAKKLGDELVIMLNSDAQVVKKKGCSFYVTQDERKEILESIRYIDKVVIDPGPDITCEAGLRLVKPDILAKGGDRVPGAMPEVEIKTCEDLGIKIVYNVGGEKVQSSSWLIKRQKEKH
jgi:cytidyltransferase-like protein